MSGWELIVLLLAWGLAGGSPGPATLAISGTAMARGRRAGVVAGAGILAGSAVWGLASALGMGAVMLGHAWLFTALKYAGAVYLGYLAIRSMRSALRAGGATGRDAAQGPMSHVFLRCALIHLTNPKAILAWGSIYAIALPADTGPNAVFVLFGQLLCVSGAVFLGYGLLFSSAWIVQRYIKARRVFEALFGLLFGAASVRILTTQAI